jgi:hypothetical protein
VALTGAFFLVVRKLRRHPARALSVMAQRGARLALVRWGAACEGARLRRRWLETGALPAGLTEGPAWQAVVGLLQLPPSRQRWPHHRHRNAGAVDATAPGVMIPLPPRRHVSPASTPGRGGVTSRTGRMHVGSPTRPHAERSRPPDPRAKPEVAVDAVDPGCEDEAAAPLAAPHRRWRVYINARSDLNVVGEVDRRWKLRICADDTSSDGTLPASSQTCTATLGPAMVARVGFLRRVSLLQELGPAEMGQLAAAMNEQTYEHEAIVVEGESGSAMFVLSEGTAVVRKAESRQVIRTYSAGDYFGELALLSADGRRRATVDAVGCV